MWKQCKPSFAGIRAPETIEQQIDGKPLDFALLFSPPERKNAAIPGKFPAAPSRIRRHALGMPLRHPKGLPRQPRHAESESPGRPVFAAFARAGRFSADFDSDSRQFGRIARRCRHSSAQIAARLSTRRSTLPILVANSRRYPCAPVILAEAHHRRDGACPPASTNPFVNHHLTA